MQIFQSSAAKKARSTTKKTKTKTKTKTNKKKKKRNVPSGENCFTRTKEFDAVVVWGGGFGSELEDNTAQTLLHIQTSIVFLKGSVQLRRGALVLGAEGIVRLLEARQRRHEKAARHHAVSGGFVCNTCVDNGHLLVRDNLRCSMRKSKTHDFV